MGIAPSYPITRSPIIFEPNAYFNITGKTCVSIVTFVSTSTKTSCSMDSCNTKKIAQLPKIMTDSLLGNAFSICCFQWFFIFQLSLSYTKALCLGCNPFAFKIVFFFTGSIKVFPFFRFVTMLLNSKRINKETRFSKALLETEIHHNERFEWDINSLKLFLNCYRNKKNTRRRWIKKYRISKNPRTLLGKITRREKEISDQ